MKRSWRVLSSSTPLIRCRSRCSIRFRSGSRPAATTRASAPRRPLARASKSAASRHLVSRMSEKLRSFLTRRLDELDVLMLDGLQIARDTVVALGILSDGCKVVLGLWQGST